MCTAWAAGKAGGQGSTGLWAADQSQLCLGALPGPLWLPAPASPTPGRRNSKAKGGVMCRVSRQVLAPVQGSWPWPNASARLLVIAEEQGRGFSPAALGPAGRPLPSPAPSTHHLLRPQGETSRAGRGARGADSGPGH